jgi:methylglutaconyl-CoA hydratase
MNSDSKILYQVQQGIARITLNRPQKRNALDPELISQLRDAVRASAQDETVRVVVLSGAGKDFCAGMDLNLLRSSADADVLRNRSDAREFADLIVQMRHHPRPILAAVRGRALAGGCGLATAADMILASESAQFGYPEVNIGFVPAIVMALLRRSLSEKRAFELAILGEPVSAQTAFEYGLVNRVFADETFDIDLDAFASKLASKPESAVLLSKRLLYHMDAMGFETAIEAGADINALARMTEDFKRGLEKALKKS